MTCSCWFYLYSGCTWPMSSRIKIVLLQVILSQIHQLNQLQQAMVITCQLVAQLARILVQINLVWTALRTTWTTLMSKFVMIDDWRMLVDMRLAHAWPNLLLYKERECMSSGHSSEVHTPKSVHQFGLFKIQARSRNRMIREHKECYVSNLRDLSAADVRILNSMIVCICFEWKWRSHGTFYSELHPWSFCEERNHYLGIPSTDTRLPNLFLHKRAHFHKSSIPCM